MLEHLAGTALSLAAAAALLLAAAAAGLRVAAPLLPAAAAPSVRLAFGTALGLGALSLLTLGAGLAGFAGPGTAVALLGACLLFGARQLADGLRLAAASARRAASARIALSPFELAAAAFAAAFFLIVLAGALAPPVFYDPLVYHLSVPKLYLLHGRIGYLPENVHSQYPSTVQMLYLLALAVRGDIAAQLLNLMIGMLLTGVVFLVGREFAGRAAGLWAACFFFTTEAAAMTFSRAMVDAGTVLFLLLAAFAVALWERDGARDRRLLLLAGLCGGFGVASKYTALWLWALILASLWVFARRRGASPGRAAGDLLLAGAASLAVLAPWLAKTWWFTGNPVFPFAYGLFGGRNWSGEAARRFAEYNAGMSAHIGWRNLHRALLEMFLVQEAGFENLTLGPLYPLALPFLFGAGRLPRPFAWGGVLALGYLGWWVATGTVLRYLLLVVPFAALLVAHAWVTRPERSPARRFLAAAIACAMLVNLRHLAVDELVVHQPLGAALGSEGREEYLGRMLQSYNAMAWASRALPPAAKVLFIGETRAYHVERDHVANSAHDPQLIVSVIRRAGSAAAAARELRAMGFTHLLYHPEEMERLERTYGTFGWRAEERRTLDELLAREARELMRGNRVSVLELRGAAAG